MIRRIALALAAILMVVTGILAGMALFDAATLNNRVTQIETIHQGPRGVQGIPGQSVVNVPLPVGDSNCPHGGSSFTVGSTTTYACNGAPGTAGQNGVNGARGVQGPPGPAGPPGQTVCIIGKCP